MKINGREVGFAFTIGSYCDISDYVVKNPDVSSATARLHKAVFMNRAYNELNEIDEPELTVDELRKLPGHVMVNLISEMDAVEEEDKKRTVVAVEKKQTKR